MELTLSKSVDTQQQHLLSGYETSSDATTYRDQTIYITTVRDDGTKTPLFREMDDDHIIDLSVEQFAQCKSITDGTLPHIARNTFKQFLQRPQPHCLLSVGLKLQRDDNTVYLDGAHCVFWKVRILRHDQCMYRIHVGYVRVSDQSITPRYHSYWCVHALNRVINYTMSYAMIWTLIIDAILLATVYYPGHITYVVATTVFVLLPLILMQAAIYFMLCTPNQVRQICNLISYPAWLLYLPVVNIPVFLCTQHPKVQCITNAMALLFGAVTTFPLYVINLCFIFQTFARDQSIRSWHIVNLSCSLYILCVSTSVNVCNLQSKLLLMDGIAVDFIDRCKFFMLVGVALIPALLLEFIHFFPILFAYFVEDGIDASQLLWMLLLFNAPKLLFLTHMLKKFTTTTPSSASSTAFSYTCHTQNGLKLALLWLIWLMSVTLPLVPYYIMILFKVKTVGYGHVRVRQKGSLVQHSVFADGCCNRISHYYWNVVCYVSVSYVAVTVWLMLAVGVSTMSLFLFDMLCLVLFLSLFIVVTVPVSIHQFHRYFAR